MSNGKIVPIEDRIPKLKQKRRKRANRLFIIYIMFFFFLVLGILYFQSPLSDISDIAVKGNTYVEAKEIIKRSGLEVGESFWKISIKAAETQIEKHDEIAHATIQRRFPNSLTINVEENDRVGYLMSETNIFPILDNGYIIRRDSIIAGDAPIFFGWDEGKALEEMAAELQLIPEEISNMISEIHFDPTRSDEKHIQLFMNDGHEVSATIHNFSEKIVVYPSIVSTIPEEIKGVVDLEVGYFFKPYENTEKEEDETSESEG